MPSWPGPSHKCADGSMLLADGRPLADLQCRRRAELADISFNGATARRIFLVQLRPVALELVMRAVAGCGAAFLAKHRLGSASSTQRAASSRSTAQSRRS